MNKGDKGTRIIISVFTSIVTAGLVYNIFGGGAGYSGWEMLIDLFTLYHGNFAITLFLLSGVLGLVFGLFSNNRKKAIRLGGVAG